VNPAIEQARTRLWSELEDALLHMELALDYEAMAELDLSFYEVLRRLYADLKALEATRPFAVAASPPNEQEQEETT
jgi:hypothetical protein